MNGAPWGGSEELWYSTAMYLAERGVKVGCAAHAWPEKESRLQALEDAGCRVHRLPVRKKKKGAFLQNLLQKRAYRKELNDTVQQIPFTEYGTVIVNQGGFEVYTGAWRNLYKRLPRYTLVFHNYNQEQVFSASQKAALRSWIDHASVNLFAAAQMHKVLRDHLGTEIQNKAVFINPITIKPPTEPAPFLPIDQGNVIFSVFAALDVNRKAQDKLIRVLSSEKWKARPWQLFLYGEGKDKSLLEKLITDGGLKGKVLLKGHTSSVAEAMKNSHLVLQLTNIDAMPLTVIEAMAIGRPLAVTNIGDMPAWVHEGENGWVCSTSEEAIEACLEKAWQQREQWKQMGQRSFDIFQQQYPQQVEESFLKLLLI